MAQRRCSHRKGEALQLHQLYRATFCRQTKEAIEQAIFYQVDDLLNLGVDVSFYDTTSLHFEVNEENEGDKDGQIHGIGAAGKKAYTAPESELTARTAVATHRRSPGVRLVVSLVDYP